MGCAGHIHPGATHRLRPPELCALTRPVSSYPPPQHRTSPTTPHPSTHNPSRSPVRSIPPLLSPRGPPPAGSAGPAHYPESAATRPARKRDHPSPSSSSTPPFLLLLACSPLPALRALLARPGCTVLQAELPPVEGVGWEAVGRNPGIPSARNRTGALPCAGANTELAPWTPNYSRHPSQERGGLPVTPRGPVRSRGGVWAGPPDSILESVR